MPQRYYVTKTRLKDATRDLWLVLDRKRDDKVVYTASTRREARFAAQQRNEFTPIFDREEDLAYEQHD